MCRSMAGNVFATVSVVLLLLMCGSSRQSTACAAGSTITQWPKAYMVNDHKLQCFPSTGSRTSCSRSTWQSQHTAAYHAGLVLATFLLIVHLLMETTPCISPRLKPKQCSARHLPTATSCAISQSNTSPTVTTHVNLSPPVSMDWMQVDPLSLDAFHYEHFLDCLQSGVLVPNTCVQQRYRKRPKCPCLGRGEPWRGFLRHVATHTMNLLCAAHMTRKSKPCCVKRKCSSCTSRHWRQRRHRRGNDYDDIVQPLVPPVERTWKPDTHTHTQTIRPAQCRRSVLCKV